MLKLYEGSSPTRPPAPSSRNGEPTVPVSTTLGKIASEIPTLRSTPNSKLRENRLA